jgi:hypothetical protein
MRVLCVKAELTKNFHYVARMGKSFCVRRGEFFEKSNDQRMPSGDATAPPSFPPRVILPQRSPGDQRDKHAGGGKNIERTEKKERYLLTDLFSLLSNN